MLWPIDPKLSVETLIVQQRFKSTEQCSAIRRANISSNLTSSSVAEGSNRAHSNKRIDSTRTLMLMDVRLEVKVRTQLPHIFGYALQRMLAHK